MNLGNQLFLHGRTSHHFFNRTFPHNQAFDASCLQFVLNDFVPSDIIIEFLLPELNTRFGRVRIFAILMSVLETAMHKNCRIVLTQKYVGMSQNGFICNPVAIAFCKKNSFLRYTSSLVSLLLIAAIFLLRCSAVTISAITVILLPEHNQRTWQPSRYGHADQPDRMRYTVWGQPE